MATPLITRYQRGDTIDYTPAGAVSAGDAVVINSTIVGIAPNDIAAGVKGAIDISGTYKFPKTASGGVIPKAGQAAHLNSAGTLISNVPTSTSVRAGVFVYDAADADAFAYVKMGSGPGNGLKRVEGTVALDGSNPTSITHGLVAVLAVLVSIDKATAPGVGTSIITYHVNGTAVDFYAWKPTSNSDPTLIASTGTETFSYSIVGY